MDDIATFRHQFLLAMPELGGTYFGGTITYLCEHSADGALGLMINRPLSLSLGDLYQQLDIQGIAYSDCPVLEGGPVQSSQGFVLHTDDLKLDASVTLSDGLMLSTAREVLEAIAADEGPRHFLVALGYAGWGEGQLEQEIVENSWLTCPAEQEILFRTPLQDRVSSAAATLGIDFSLIAQKPGHA